MIELGKLEIDLTFLFPSNAVLVISLTGLFPIIDSKEISVKAFPDSSIVATVEII